MPRLLELTAAGELNDFSVAIYLPGKLVPCLAAGTPEERAAVHRFLATWWTSTLATWPAPVEATDVYEIATRTGVPAGPLLGQWPAAEPGHLAAFVTDAAQRDPGPEVAEWLRSEVPAALLTAAGNTATDLELLEELSWALELLEVVQHELAGGLGDRTGQ